MRVIGGSLKGRTFDIKLKDTRPTTDYARESLYNILENNWEFDELSFLDLFAGTGAHSFEFISRGCYDVTAVDSNYQSIKFIKQITEQWGEQDKIQAISTDVFRFLQGHHRQYDIIFADPPYHMADLQKIPKLVMDNKLLTDEGWLILEHSVEVAIEDTAHRFHERKYGSTLFTFFRYDP